MTKPFSAAIAILGVGLAALPCGLARGQGPVDHVRLLGHYVQAEIAMVRCRPAEVAGRTGFIEHLKIVEGRAVAQLKLRFPGLSPAQIDEMLGEGRRAMEKSIRETISHDGCAAPLVEELRRRYEDFANRAP